MKIAILSNINDPLYGYFISSLKKLNCSISAIVMDEKKYSKKDKDIFLSRTGGKLPNIGLSELNKELIPCNIMTNHNSIETIRLLKKLKIDLIINSGSPRILKSRILNYSSYGILNCHPGLLPHYRGCCCVEWAIYNNDKVGNTIHIMNEGIDKGPILMKEELIFGKNDKYQDIRVKVYKNGVNLMTKVVDHIINKKIQKKDYIEQGKGKYYSAISNEKLDKVIKLLDDGKYKYQI